ncbi:MAG: ORF6N domain-containing protein [Prevotella sp.]|nr:ORF6N domain-containing protein [Prevotella sp.]
MAKKIKETEEKAEPITNCNRLLEPVANCGHLVVNEETFSQSDIERMIVTVRGVQVLIDRDLAALYQVEVKQMNRQVKRNKERFPEDFMFQLTKEELASLKCHFGTSNSRGGDRRALPYAFTQQGIGMLSGLLRSEIAIKTNVKIMRAFVGMQRFIAANAQIFQRLDHVEMQQLENKQWMQQTDDKIATILHKIEEKAPKLLPEQIFQTGCVWDAWAYVSDLVRSAKDRIVLIDNFVQLPHRNHDRFLIIDDKVYFMGASLKDMGAGLCAVKEMLVAPEVILGLVK